MRLKPLGRLFLPCKHEYAILNFESKLQVQAIAMTLVLIPNLKLKAVIKSMFSSLFVFNW